MCWFSFRVFDFRHLGHLRRRSSRCSLNISWRIWSLMIPEILRKYCKMCAKQFFKNVQLTLTCKNRCRVCTLISENLSISLTTKRYSYLHWKFFKQFTFLKRKCCLKKIKPTIFSEHFSILKTWGFVWCFCLTKPQGGVPQKKFTSK